MTGPKGLDRHGQGTFEVTPAPPAGEMALRGAWIAVPRFSVDLALLVGESDR